MSNNTAFLLVRILLRHVAVSVAASVVVGMPNLSAAVGRSFSAITEAGFRAIVLRRHFRRHDRDRSLGKWPSNHRGPIHRSWSFTLSCCFVDASHPRHFGRADLEIRRHAPILARSSACNLALSSGRVLNFTTSLRRILVAVSARFGFLTVCHNRAHIGLRPL